MKKITILLGTLFVAGCGMTATDDRTPATANGKTPIRYIICSNDDTNCFVAARFKDFDGCKSHDRWASMLCDSTSMPGKMVCEEDRGPKIAVSYCTM